jgi:putative flippase GtrA
LAASGFVLLGSVLWTSYIVDFIAAWALGIVFQYFAIRPMRDDLSRGAAVAAAIKADTLSILAFQMGMYAWMALVYFRFFPAPHLTPFDPRYWLMMQIAMICGFVTSYPMNRLLIALGWKERM